MVPPLHRGVAERVAERVCVQGEGASCGKSEDT